MRCFPTKLNRDPPNRAATPTLKYKEEPATANMAIMAMKMTPIPIWNLLSNLTLFAI